MKKVGTWFLNNLKWLFAVIAFGATILIAGSVILGSYNSYKAYEKAYDANDLAVRSEAPAAPKSIEINDEFKSAYKNTYVAAAEELTVTGGEDAVANGYVDLTTSGGQISLDLILETKSFVDIDFLVGSAREYTENDETMYGVKDLLNNVTFTVNGENMEETVDLETSGSTSEFHRLVMSGFALPAGTVNVTIKSKSGKAALMPLVKSITLFSSERLSAPEPVEE